MMDHKLLTLSHRRCYNRDNKFCYWHLAIATIILDVKLYILLLIFTQGRLKNVT